MDNTRDDPTPISSSTDDRSLDRRGGDRRKGQIPFEGEDRRKGNRRSGEDRRKNERRSGYDRRGQNPE